MEKGSWLGCRRRYSKEKNEEKRLTLGTKEEIRKETFMG